MNVENVPVDICQQPAAFPTPTSFIWNKDGLPLAGHMLTYSSMTFATVRREDAGNYAVSTTSFVPDGKTEMVGTDTGGFSPNVICKLHAAFMSYKLLDGPVFLLLKWTGINHWTSTVLHTFRQQFFPCLRYWSKQQHSSY